MKKNKTILYFIAIIIGCFIKIASAKQALIVIDFVNDIVSPNGKLATCAKYLRKHPVIQNTNRLIFYFRANKLPIFFARLAFKPDYSDCPADWAFVKEKGALKLGTWGSELIGSLDYNPSVDTLITKNRVSPFYETNLNKMLKQNKIDSLVISGVATNNAIDLFAREGWDMGYVVIVIKDACGASDVRYHGATLFSLPTMIKQKNTSEYLKENTKREIK